MTSYYASIEQLEREIPHLSMDIWSLGIIAYKLMSKKEPYMQLSDLKRSKAIKENPREKLPEYYPQALRDLAGYMLTVDSDERPTIEEVLR